MTKESNKKHTKALIILLVISIVLAGTLLPIGQATNIKNFKGCNKGPSYTYVVPTKKTTFVGFDEDSYLDDYAYLAAVPTAVFKDDGKLISHPLLYYQEKLDYDDEKYRSLDAYEGIKFFMEDWMSYCNGQLDQMTLINVPKNKIHEDWDADEYVEIEDDNPYDIASKIALQDWSYSKKAVVAVIDDEFEKPDNTTVSKIEGTISTGKEIIKKSFLTDKLNKLNPRFHEFEVPEGYKYLKSRTWWASIYLGRGGDSDFPIHINITIPAADPDSQLYCKYDDDWMQVAATAGWNLGGMDKERAETYIYKSGQWRLGITDVPTKGNLIGKNGKIIDIIKNLITEVKFQTDITMFPGVEQILPINPPFGCRDATFKLTWDNPHAQLGFSIIGPAGEEIITASENNDYQEIHLDQLGECLPGESYSISVFTLNELTSPVNYDVEYSWQQNYSKAESNALASATEGAVLASQLNAPLLYIKKDSVPKATENALYKLGVENIYLVNLGNHLTSDVKQNLQEFTNIKKLYRNPLQIYEAIMDLTNENDIIFSTIDPWTQWLVAEVKPDEETKAGLFIGPAAYCAAHHGSPVILVEMHPELSSAIVWHTEYWKRHANGNKKPIVAQMYITGRRAYDFLKEHNFDQEGEESMITVAGQFEIGATWDRVFTGKAKPGRIFGSPVDTAYWISHNMFYPALIFENPALDPNGNDLIQGSKSHRSKILPWGSIGLKIDKKSQVETFQYPVLQMYVSYEQRLNERFNNYYGFRYKSADNIIPGLTESNEPIDENIMPGVKGSVWPDMSTTEVVPKYLAKGGYDSVFSSRFSAITDNLNDGVIMFITSTHGSGAESGMLFSWEPEKSTIGILPDILSKRFGYTKESNPWRAYEWYLGSTENPDTMTMETHGFIAALLGNPKIDGLLPTGEDFWPSERPILHGVFGLLNKIPVLKWFIPEWLASSEYYKDGMVIAHTFSSMATSISEFTGYNLDDELENIHSCGWINLACLPAFKYMHLAMIRHGSPYQVIDPWPTSWYSALWLQTMPRDIILGDTIGEAYTKGISHVGILYTGGSVEDEEKPQWWWDTAENVCFFGDPDLRVFTPENSYSTENHWKQKDTKAINYDEELNLNGHMPYGATAYPNAKQPKSFLEKYFVYMILMAIILVIIIFGLKRKKSK